MALHPDFPETPALFVAYNGIPGGQGPVISIVSRFSSEDGGNTFAAGSEEVLFALEQRDRFHHLGAVAFGLDGYLYVGYGDGTVPFRNAQNLDNLYGALLRVDVDSGSPYAIPPDNPLVGTGYREEIFAWGLRNPWRFTIDRETGIVWAGDVGNDSREEVDQVLKGGNYGWPILEGNQCVDSTPCDTTDFTPPLFDYPHNADGAASVIGGYVYRGSAIPALYGVYVFADYFASQVWTLSMDGAGQAEQAVLMPSQSVITCFAEDNVGELYYFNGGFGAEQGRIYKIIPPES
jgi:glucose/arabinose dehydrogenase